MSRQSNVIIALSKELDCTYIEALAFADRMSARGYEFALRDWIADAAHAMEAMRVGRIKSTAHPGGSHPGLLQRTRLQPDRARIGAPNRTAAPPIRGRVDGAAR